MRFLRGTIPPFGKRLLRAPNSETLNIKQLVDPARQGDIGRTVVTTITGSLKRTQRRKTRFPIPQYMLGQTKIRRQFANRKKRAFDLHKRQVAPILYKGQAW